MGIEGPASEPDSRKDSAPLADGPRDDGHGRARGQSPTPRGSVTVGAVASNDEIGAALARAVLDGRDAVADELTRALRARREASAGNVVRLRGAS